MTESVFQRCGAWLSGLAPEAMPEAARTTAKRAVLDLLGVAAAGSGHDLAGRLEQYLVAAGLDGGPCRLFGSTRRARPEAAALLNSAVGHVLDFDDSSNTLLGHPTTVIVPALLALADIRPTSGLELLTAYGAGFEVAAHLARQVNDAHYGRGWHPTATLGVFASAAAAARLLGLDAGRSAHALEIASACAAGLRAHFGTHMKPVQVGNASRNGVTAALLASVGIEGGASAFEHGQGFGAVYNGEDGFGAEPFDDSPRRHWDLVDPGLAIKQYPCCASTHPAIDAAVDLLTQLDGCTIERIGVRLHPRRLRHTDNPDPKTTLEAKFSVQYVVASTLHAGPVGLRDFTPDALARPGVRALLDRTEAAPFPPEECGPDHYAGEVRLELAGGRTLRRRVDRARGRDIHTALTDDEVRRKFVSCAEPVLGSTVAGALLERITSLEEMQDVSSLTEALAFGVRGDVP